MPAPKPTRIAVALATLAVASACGGHSARREQPRPSLVPKVQAHRIAASWSGAHSYLPTWAPSGVALASWEIISDAGAGNDRLVVHFVRRSATLKWQVSDSRELAWVRAHIDCQHPKPAAKLIDGRTVYHRSADGVETAWICLSIGFPLTIAAEQRASSVDAVSASELERMVASARALSPGRARDSAYELAPPDEVRRMATGFGGPFFLPRQLPNGFVFSQRHVLAHDPDRDGRRSLLVTFGRDGLLLEWGVYSGVDKLGLDCPSKSSAFAPKPAALINGRRVYFDAGIHGASAWTCVPGGAVGTKPLEVELWYDIRLDNAAMRHDSMRLVAAARVVRSGRGAPPRATTTPATRSCGFQGLGKGWYLRASQSVSCTAAKATFTSYFSAHGCNGAGAGTCVVGGYRCCYDYTDDIERVRCTRAQRAIAFRSLP